MSVNWKLTCKTFVQIENELHVFCKIEFWLVDNGNSEFLSNNDNVTSGFDVIDAHTIGYILLLKSFIKFIVWFSKTVEELKNICMVGVTFFEKNL